MSVMLVAGGQLDFNLGRFLRRCVSRRVPFKELLVGPGLVPRISADVSNGEFKIDNRTVNFDSCFFRHDVFLHQQGFKNSNQISLNWFYTIKGWATSCDHVQMFNKRISGSENNKVQNLVLASTVGLDVPKSMLTNVMPANDNDEELIRKPVAGGAYTEPVPPDQAEKVSTTEFPYFVQPRLKKPEFRMYRVGDANFAFEVQSSEIDYRLDPDVTIKEAQIPRDIVDKFMALCDVMNLDFAAADFMTGTDAGLTFLEINTQPMFAAFDAVADGRLCDAMIDFLCFE